MQELLNQTSVKRILSWGSWLVAIGLVFMLVKTVNEYKKGMYIGRDVAVQSTIVVTGEGEVLAKPDIATFSFTVTDNAAVVADAQKKVEDKIALALQSIKKGGVDEKDIKTDGYSINPKYEYYYQPQPMITCSAEYCPNVPVKAPKIVGYEVSQTVTVKIRKIENSGTLLASVGGAGVSNVSGLTFSIDKEELVKADARDKAIKDAQLKAEKLADSLKVKLVRIVSFNENEGGYPQYYRSDAVSLSGGRETKSVSIPTGENQIKSNVSVTYEIR